MLVQCTESITKKLPVIHKPQSVTFRTVFSKNSSLHFVHLLLALAGKKASKIRYTFFKMCQP